MGNYAPCCVGDRDLMMGQTEPTDEELRGGSRFAAAVPAVGRHDERWSDPKSQGGERRRRKQFSARASGAETLKMMSAPMPREDRTAGSSRRSGDDIGMRMPSFVARADGSRGSRAQKEDNKSSVAALYAFTAPPSLPPAASHFAPPESCVPMPTAIGMSRRMGRRFSAGISESAVALARKAAVEEEKPLESMLSDLLVDDIINDVTSALPAEEVDSRKAPSRQSLTLENAAAELGKPVEQILSDLSRSDDSNSEIYEIYGSKGGSWTCSKETSRDTTPLREHIMETASTVDHSYLESSDIGTSEWEDASRGRAGSSN